LGSLPQEKFDDFRGIVKEQMTVFLEQSLHELLRRHNVAQSAPEEGSKQENQAEESKSGNAEPQRVEAELV